VTTSAALAATNARTHPVTPQLVANTIHNILVPTALAHGVRRHRRTPCLAAAGAGCAGMKVRTVATGSREYMMPADRLIQK